MELFQILTGRLPFEFKTFVEYVDRILHDAPPKAIEVDETVPGDLSWRTTACHLLLRPSPDAAVVADRLGVSRTPEVTAELVVTPDNGDRAEATDRT